MKKVKFIYFIMLCHSYLELQQQLLFIKEYVGYRATPSRVPVDPRLYAFVRLTPVQWTIFCFDILPKFSICGALICFIMW